MSRTQKKCMIASGALHLLLLVILVVAPAFLIKEEEEEPVDQTVLTLVNTEVADAPVAQAAPPEPTRQPPIQQPLPPPEAPQKKPVERKKPEPEVKPPTKKPDPVPVKPVKKPELTPKPPATKRVEVEIDLTEHRVDDQAAQEAAREAAEAHKKEVERIFESSKVDVSTVKTDLNPVARVSGVTYDNYGSTVRSVYMRIWTPPNDIPAKHSSATVEIVILKSGKIKSAKIISRSGSSKLDRNITDLIKNKVKNIGTPFPSGAKETERTYTIEFNLNLKFNG